MTDKIAEWQRLCDAAEPTAPLAAALDDFPDTSDPEWNADVADRYGAALDRLYAARAAGERRDAAARTALPLLLRVAEAARARYAPFQATGSHADFAAEQEMARRDKAVLAALAALEAAE